VLPISAGSIPLSSVNALLTALFRGNPPEGELGRLLAHIDVDHSKAAAAAEHGAAADSAVVKRADLQRAIEELRVIIAKQEADMQWTSRGAW
jgi:hypothetical protein